jgi:hypothetical protein
MKLVGRVGEPSAAGSTAICRPLGSTKLAERADGI